MKRIIHCIIFLYLSAHVGYAQQTVTISGNQTETKPAGTFAQVNGINMYFETYGTGTPLLMIHGNGGSSKDFEKQIPVFSKKYKVIVADSRGHGQTNNNSDSMTYEMMAADYNSLLEYLKIDSAYILGWSDGGIIGLLLARDYPKKVKMLATMGANISPDSSAVPQKVISWLELEIKKTRMAISQNDEKAKEYMQLLNLMYYQPNIAASSLHKISAPVLIMSGDRDIIKLQHSLQIYQNIPRAQFCVIPGSTHFVVVENAYVFNQVVQRFFNDKFSMPDSMDYFK